MKQRVQLKHPQGKKAVSMTREKYDLLKRAVVHYLNENGGSTFRDMSKGIERAFKAKRRPFQGSLPWHLEWVKLDLEARKVIKRVPDSSPQRYSVVR
jgi:hypothetical protein